MYGLRSRQGEQIVREVDLQARVPTDGAAGVVDAVLGFGGECPWGTVAWVC